MRYIYIILTLFFIAPTAFAQNFNEVAIGLEPEYPKPGDVIKISLQSYSQNLQGSKIGWYLDDVLLKEDVGLTENTITAPLLGEHITLIIKVNNKEQARRIITPTAVDILWEAQTYIPQHFMGRALPVDSSTIKAVALPHLGDAKKTENLIYNWYKGGRLLTKLSGRGRSTIITASPSLYDDYNLSIEITDSHGIVLSKNGVKITTVEPEILFYTSSPLLGINFTKAITTNNAQQLNNESAFVALPYYFSIANPQELTYKWRVSNARSLRGTQSNDIIITNKQTDAGISLTVQHPNVLLQSASTLYKFPNIDITNNNYSEPSSYESPFGVVE